MKIGFILIANSMLLGFGLAMDAFSVSIANGLREAGMKRGRMRLIAGVYSFFQALMPMIGWICIHTIVERFQAFHKWTPWVAWALLCYIGGKMVLESVRGHKDENNGHDDHDIQNGQNSPENALKGDKRGESTVQATGSRIKTGELIVQGIATSIDALSVGLTLADYGWKAALLSAAIIAAVTYVICMGGLLIGKKIGSRLSSKAGLLGGAVLIFIGFEILIRSFLA